MGQHLRCPIDCRSIGCDQESRHRATCEGDADEGSQETNGPCVHVRVNVYENDLVTRVAQPVCPKGVQVKASDYDLTSPR